MTPNDFWTLPVEALAYYIASNPDWDADAIDVFMIRIGRSADWLNAEDYEDFLYRQLELHSGYLF